MSDTRTKILGPEDITPRGRAGMAFPYLDEFVARGVTVHFEAMNNSQFWIGITHPDGREWHINCGAVNPLAKGYAHIDEWPEPAGEQP